MYLLTGILTCDRCGPLCPTHNSRRLAHLLCYHGSVPAVPAEAYAVAVAMARLGLPDAQAGVLPRQAGGMADPAYALVGTSTAGIRAVIGALVDIRRAPGDGCPGRAEVGIIWRTDLLAGLPVAGLLGVARPPKAWWDSIQDLGDNGIFADAEVSLAEHSPPLLTAEQRWVRFVK